MNEEEQEQFQLSNTCWISEKLIDNDDENVTDHCLVTNNLEVQLIRAVTDIFN